MRTTSPGSSFDISVAEVVCSSPSLPLRMISYRNCGSRPCTSISEGSPVICPTIFFAPSIDIRVRTMRSLMFCGSFATVSLLHQSEYGEVVLRLCRGTAGFERCWRSRFARRDQQRQAEIANLSGVAVSSDPSWTTPRAKSTEVSLIVRCSWIFASSFLKAAISVLASSIELVEQRLPTLEYLARSDHVFTFVANEDRQRAQRPQVERARAGVTISELHALGVQSVPRSRAGASTPPLRLGAREPSRRASVGSPDAFALEAVPPASAVA